jgi:hypothetical protein
MAFAIQSSVRGVLTSAWTLMQPADCPNTVMFPGSPPKAAMFSRTQRRAAIWSNRA